MVEQRTKFLGRCASHSCTPLWFMHMSDRVRVLLTDWLTNPNATTSELQFDLLEMRTSFGEPPQLLLDALRIASEATSAGWTVGDVFAHVAELVPPVLETSTTVGAANGTSSARSVSFTVDDRAAQVA